MVQMKIRFYPTSKAQKMVELFFILTVYPVCSMVESDFITANKGFVYIGVLALLTVFNTVVGNYLLYLKKIGKLD